MLREESMDRKKIKAAYEAQRVELLNKIALKKQESSIDSDGDECDQIQAKILATVCSSLAERDSLLLKCLDAALARVELEEFGECEQCGGEIAENRLIALPGKVTCICCAEENEKRMKLYAFRSVGNEY